MVVRKEEWKVIDGYEDYSVSNFGRVKKRLIKKKTTGTCGYQITRLSNEHGPKNHKIHRLVAAAFIEGFEERNTVTHKNGRKGNNRVDNLQLGYRSEITIEDVLFIKKHAKKLGGTMNNAELARMYNVSTVAIFKIVNGQSRVGG